MDVSLFFHRFSFLFVNFAHVWIFLTVPAQSTKQKTRNLSIPSVNKARAEWNKSILNWNWANLCDSQYNLQNQRSEQPSFPSKSTLEPRRFAYSHAAEIWELTSKCVCPRTAAADLSVALHFFTFYFSLNSAEESIQHTKVEHLIWKESEKNLFLYTGWEKWEIYARKM